MILATQSVIAARCSCRSLSLKKNCILFNLFSTTEPNMNNSRNNWKYKCIKREVSKLMFNLGKEQLDGLARGVEVANVGQRFNSIVDEIKEFQEFIDHSILKDLSKQGLTYTEYRPAWKTAASGAADDDAAANGGAADGALADGAAAGNAPAPEGGAVIDKQPAAQGRILDQEPDAQGAIMDKEPVSQNFATKEGPALQGSATKEVLEPEASSSKEDSAAQTSAPKRGPDMRTLMARMDDEEYLFCKKYYNEYLKVYTEVEYEDTEVKILFAQFFTDVRKPFEEFSVRLEHNIVSGEYLLLCVNPANTIEEKVQKILQETRELQDILCAIRRAFASMNNKKE